MIETPSSVHEFKARQIVSHDADEQAATLFGWTQTYDQLTPGQFVGSLTELNFAATHLFCETMSHKLHQRCEIPDAAWWFGIPVGGDMPGSIHATPICADALAFRPGGCEFELLTPPDYSILGVVVGAETLMRYAEQYCESKIPNIHIANEIICIGAQKRFALSEMLQMILREGRSVAEVPGVGTPGAATSGAVASGAAAQRNVEATILATLVEFGVLPTKRQKARHISSARRAQIAADARDFALANRDRAVGILELCGVLHVSRRTLQYCFEYAYDTTPQNYLRALRLNGVRRELSVLERGSKTIRNVATSWGFWHMSQFAQDYRTLFGVLPSDTLITSAANAG